VQLFCLIGLFNIEKRFKEALKRAKIEMLKSGTYANPLYWATFVMYGE
jgi:CHAT domain-containing protein